MEYNYQNKNKNYHYILKENDNTSILINDQKLIFNIMLLKD